MFRYAQPAERRNKKVEKIPKEPSPQQKLAHVLAERDLYRALAARLGMSPQAAAAAANLARSLQAAADLHERGLSGEREAMIGALDQALPRDLAGAFAGSPTRSPGQQLKPREWQEQQPIEETPERTLDPGGVTAGRSAGFRTPAKGDPALLK
jgi:hypothetical protein